MQLAGSNAADWQLPAAAGLYLVCHPSPVPLGSPSSLLRALPATLKAQQLWLAVGSDAAATWARACRQQRAQAVIEQFNTSICSQGGLIASTGAKGTE